jgi:hydroxymethylpyrimidine/phosphomethylpyrimidine kinase
MMEGIELRRVLAIGGSDSGGGAGIQADIKTGAALGVDVATAITAITAQNSVGVQAVEPVPLNVFRTQLSSVCSDIPLHAVKLGVLYDGARVKAAIDVIQRYGLNNIVCDPVIASTSGTILLDGDGMKALVSALPLFTLLTPNAIEAAALTGKRIETQSDLITAGYALLDLGASAVLMKGGHLNENESTDVLLRKKHSGLIYFSFPRIRTSNDHGTGCALATSIASGLAKGLDLPKAVAAGRDFVQGALLRSIQLRNGTGRGSMDLVSHGTIPRGSAWSGYLMPAAQTTPRQAGPQKKSSAANLPAA